MKPVLIVVLVLSLLANVAAAIFIGVLMLTPTFDVPLAAYSHYKNCERDFDSVLKYADNLPTENRDTAKQLFGSIVCQKDYKTGKPLTEQDFNALLKQLQASGDGQTP